MVAGEIADEADIVHIDLDRVYDKIVSEMIDIRENVVKTNNVNYQSLITEFIQNNTNSILEIDEGKVINPCINSFFYILITMLKLKKITPLLNNLFIR